MEEREQQEANHPAAAPNGSMPAISDAQLREVIQQAAARGPRLPRAGAPLRAGRRRLRPFALRRVPVDRASRPQMAAAAVVVLLHWGVSIAASILYEHFRPTTAEPAQFLTLLISSLSVFAVAVIACIELMKFSRAGRSVTIGLGFINVLIVTAVAIYARHWLLVAAHLLFALGLVGLLAGRPYDADADAEGDAANLAENAAAVADNPRGVRPRGPVPVPAVAVGVLLVLLAWGTLLGPAAVFASWRAQAEARFAAAVAAWRSGTWDESERAQAEQARDTLRSLTHMSDVVGETLARKARYQARWGFLDALLGRPREALLRLDDALATAPSDEAYRFKAEAYSLAHGLPFVPGTETEEPPPGHIVPTRRYETIRGADPNAEIWDDELDY